MRHLVVPLALAALLVSGCQASPDSPPVAVDVSTSPTPSATPTPTSTPTPGEIISPDLSSTSTTCSAKAGKYPTMTKGVRFTAQTTVVNRGNIGAAVVVKAMWNGTAPLHRAQTISVGYGKKVKVTFNMPTSASEAAAFRANGVGRCGVTVKVISFLGKPRPTK